MDDERRTTAMVHGRLLLNGGIASFFLAGLPAPVLFPATLAVGSGDNREVEGEPGLTERAV